MKCPNDQTEMEKGSLIMNGTKWVSYNNGLLSKLFLSGIAPMPRVFAWKCTKCGKIELYIGEVK